MLDHLFRISWANINLVYNQQLVCPITVIIGMLGMLSKLIGKSNSNEHQREKLRYSDRETVVQIPHIDCAHGSLSLSLDRKPISCRRTVR